MADIKEILKKNIEVSGEIGATHLITHFGYTSLENYENKSKYEDLLKKQNECYEEMSLIADKNNVTLAIECLFPFDENFFQFYFHFTLLLRSLVCHGSFLR